MSGKCGNCSPGSCNGSNNNTSGDCCCSEDYSGAVRETVDFLRPLNKGPTPDNTSLETTCNCPGNPRLPKYTCVKCIGHWVASKTDEEVINKVEQFKKEGKTIASERLLAALKKRNDF